MGGRGGAAPAVKQASAPSVINGNGTQVQQAMTSIGQIYRSLAEDPRDFVSLTAVRERLGDRFPRDVVDDALRQLNNMKGNNIIPQSNQKILSTQDRASFVRIGNEDRLLISMSNFD